MADLVELSDPDDPRLADYRDLRDVELRKSLEAEHGLFLAEGEKVVRRAVEAGYDARSFLMAPRWLEGLDDVLARSDGPCYVLSEALIEQVTGFHVHRGALASLRRNPLPSVDDVLEGARSVLVLEDLVDHTNVGAIFRSGAALGFDAVLLAPRCADPLYRRSIKVGMGAVFTHAVDPPPGLVRRPAGPLASRLHHGRADPGRGLDPDRGGRRRRRPARARPRLRGPRPVGAVGGVRRPPGDHPDAGRDRLAQRRRRYRGGLLRRGPPVIRCRSLRAATTTSTMATST